MSYKSQESRESRVKSQARMVGCASASTYQGSTEPRLRSAYGLRARGVARVRLTATFACLSACRMRLLRINAS